MAKAPKVSVESLVLGRTPHKDGPRCYGYCRVSTDEQARSGLGLDDQRASIKTAAKRLKLPLWRIRTDGGKSGELPAAERSGLLKILRHIRRQDVLVVAKRDRLARDDIEIKLLERGLAKVGVRVVSAAGEGTEGTLDDPSSALQRDIHDVFAVHELRMIRSRTKAALKALRDRGERAGAVPFGFDALEDGSLVVNKKEHAAIEKIKVWKASGLSFREIGKRLSEIVKPKRGTTWHASSVRSVLLTYRKHEKGGKS